MTNHSKLQQVLTKTANGKAFKLAENKQQHWYYDFKTTLQFLQAKGQERFGHQFKIEATDHELIYKLCIIMIQDQVNAQKKGLHLNKGILLSGPVGVGKTSLMQLIPEICYRPPLYKLVPTREITFAYNEHGSKIITQYGSYNAYCFDDLGLEPTGRFYGKDANVMAEVMLSRYEFYRKCHQQKYFFQRKVAHFTTNLNASEIEKRYGKRVRSKLREMLNLIAFNAETKDKR